jgi:hypothetical protein
MGVLSFQMLLETARTGGFDSDIGPASPLRGP